MNLAKLIYDSYPGNDVLAFDEEVACKSNKALLAAMKDFDGDTLFKFIVLEILESYDDDEPNAIEGIKNRMRMAIGDLEAVLGAFEREFPIGGKKRGRKPKNVITQIEAQEQMR